MTRWISQKKIAIVASIGLFLAGIGFGTSDVEAGGPSGCTSVDWIADPLEVRTVGGYHAFYTNIVEKEVFSCANGDIVDVSTIIRQEHNKFNVLRNESVHQVTCVKNWQSNPVPNCFVGVVPITPTATISIPDDCTDFDQVWLESDDGVVYYTKNTDELSITRTVIVQKELWMNCIGGGPDILEIFVIKEAINNKPLELNTIICEKDLSTAQILTCKRIVPTL